ncbi:MAG TPA: GGDEF domain-containing protein, partial [Pirellulales bacterium]
MQFGLGVLLTVSTVELILGTLVGWFLRSRTLEGADDGEISRLRESQRQQGELLDYMLQRASQLTGNIGKDAGAHATRVQQIGHDLQMASQVPEANLHVALTGAMASVTEANEQLQQQLRDAERKLADQADELQAQVAIARTDKLTGLLNRRACDDALTQRSGEFQRYGVPLSLLMFDIDSFKSINDSHGHQAGDAVLRGVAQSLVRAMRDVDIVCRYGGDEFMILMPATDLTGAAIAAERARQQIQAAVIKHAGRSLQVTASGGVASVLAGETVADLVGRADQALYAAKKAGCNCVRLHDGAGGIHPTDAHVRPLAPADLSRQPPRAPDVRAATQPSSDPRAELPEATIDLADYVQQL